MVGLETFIPLEDAARKYDLSVQELADLVEKNQLRAVRVNRKIAVAETEMFDIIKGIVDFVGVLAGGHFVAFDAKSTRNTRSWRVKTSRRSPCNDSSHQWEYLAEVHALGGLAFYLIYAEGLDRVFVARMPFPVDEAQRFNEMIEVVKDENGWWDWLRTLEQAGILRT